MNLSLSTVLNAGYSNAQAQGILDKFHKDTPDTMRSYRIFDGELGKGGKITRVVRRKM